MSRTATLETPAVQTPRLKDPEFRYFQELVYREAGIHLGPQKRDLLISRLLQRLRELALEDFGAYRRLVEEDADERVRMIERVCTHETRFFREPYQFELLEKRLIPLWLAVAEVQGPRPIRVWSAGCSTGEEPFSIAMTLLHGLPGWTVDVLATDLSNRALERARAAVWPADQAREIPQHLLKKYLLKGVRSQKGWMRAAPQLREVVRFQRINLNEAAWPFDTRFDLVFCRNVLIYFDAPSRERALHRLVRHLAPGGHLFLGHAESLLGSAERVRPVIPSVYSLTGEV
ncbi:MAG TPA: protein-glutamate O-methyltransferase CheR [Thermoanaerobaculia bacterium]|nr:protein-glutamate O-methyltransferase CheR [Thermoanaerobaculia bacterium]